MFVPVNPKKWTAIYTGDVCVLNTVEQETLFSMIVVGRALLKDLKEFSGGKQSLARCDSAIVFSVLLGVCNIYVAS